MIPRSRTGSLQKAIKNLKRKKPTNGTSFTRVVRGSAGLGRPVWVLLSLASARTPESLPKHGSSSSFCNDPEARPLQTNRKKKEKSGRRRAAIAYSTELLHDPRGYVLLKWREGTNYS